MRTSRKLNVTARSFEDPVLVCALNTGHPWTHMDFSNPNSANSRWTSKCSTPCKIIFSEQEKAHMLWTVYYYDPPDMPALGKHQKLAVVALEPTLGFVPTPEVYREWFLGSDNGDLSHPVGKLIYYFLGRPSSSR